MASQFDISNLTLNPEEVKDLSQAILERFFNDPELSDLHEIIPGIRYKTQILFLEKLGLAGEKLVGCKPEEATGVEFKEKEWDPEFIAQRWVHCANHVNKLFKPFNKARKMNPDYFDRIDSEELGVLLAFIGEALRESVQRLAWFGSKTVDTDGLIPDTAVHKYFDAIDGLWKQIFTEVPTTGAGSEFYVEIPENALATTAEQLALAGDTAYNTMKAMWEKMDDRLSDQEGLQIMVTRTLYDNYYCYLESNTVSNGFLERLEDGSMQPMFRGIPVKKVSHWDRTIKSYYDDGTKLFRPHRALLTVKENIPIGTLSVDDFETNNGQQGLVSFYDPREGDNVIDFTYSLDSKFLEPYLSMVAY